MVFPSNPLQETRQNPERLRFASLRARQPLKRLPQPTKPCGLPFWFTKVAKATSHLSQQAVGLRILRPGLLALAGRRCYKTPFSKRPILAVSLTSTRWSTPRTPDPLTARSAYAILQLLTYRLHQGPIFAIQAPSPLKGFCADGVDRHQSRRKMQLGE